MKHIVVTGLIAVLSLLMQSCFKEDEMIQPHDRGTVKTDTIALTENYRYQQYFSLDSGRIVTTVVKTSSDLGFECNPVGWHVILNTSTFMKACDLGPVEFGIKQDTTGKKLVFDKSDGNPDSTAIHIWFKVEGEDTISNNHVYAIDRGLDENGNSLGAFQVIFDSLKSGIYYFRYANMNGGQTYSGSVSKDKSVNYRWYSLTEHKAKDLEPDLTSYDLLFTQYTTMLYTDEGIPYPYLVTGALINRQGVYVAIDTSLTFSEIKLEDIAGKNFSEAMDAIGYDWKYYDFNSGVYSIRPNLNYLIRSVDKFYFKLRFIGFYDKNGSKGYPVIEYQRL